MNFEVNKYYKHYGFDGNIHSIYKILSLRLIDSEQNYVLAKYIVNLYDNNLVGTNDDFSDNSAWANNCELILGNEEQCLKFCEKFKKNIKKP